jgi:hypothetical protein
MGKGNDPNCASGAPMPHPSGADAEPYGGRTPSEYEAERATLLAQDEARIDGLRAQGLDRFGRPLSVEAAIDHFEHRGPGGDEAMPEQVRALLLAIKPGESAQIAGITVTRQAGGRYDVAGDPNLSSPWVAMQSLRSLRREQLILKLRAYAQQLPEEQRALVRLAAADFDRYGKFAAHEQDPIAGLPGIRQAQLRALRP